MKKMWLIGVLSLSGCASLANGGMPTPEALTAAVRSEFVGYPVEKVINRHGRPREQFRHGPLTMYRFVGSNTMTYEREVESRTTGTVGRTNVPYSATTTTQQPYDRTYECSLIVGVRPDGIVDDIGFEGKVGGCIHFMP